MLFASGPSAKPPAAEIVRYGRWPAVWPTRLQTAILGHLCLMSCRPAPANASICPDGRIYCDRLSRHPLAMYIDTMYSPLCRNTVHISHFIHIHALRTWTASSRCPVCHKCMSHQVENALVGVRLLSIIPIVVFMMQILVVVQVTR